MLPTWSSSNWFQSGETPPDNFWSGVEKTASMSLSNSNLTATSGAANQQVETAALLPVGKIYFEVEVTTFGATTTSAVGFCRAAYNTPAVSPRFTFDAGSGGYEAQGRFRFAGSATTGKTAWTPGDIIMCARDRTTGRIWFGINGVWDGNPAAGTGQAGTLNPGGDLYGVIYHEDAGEVYTLAPDVSRQTYAAPSGFTAIG